MFQVLCRQSTGKMCDGSCGDPMCVVAHNREITTYCSGCVQLRADLAAAQRELAAHKKAIAEFSDLPEPQLSRIAGIQIRGRIAELLAQEGGK